MPDAQDIRVDHGDGAVVLIEFDRPPHNFLSAGLVSAIADQLAALEDDPGCRSIVLASTGRHFCAGVDFGGGRPTDVGALYGQAVRLFSYSKPIVAAVQGAAIGGGLGLAMSADLRVVGPGSRLSANFARLGIHHGFGLSVTLPNAIGSQKALELLYTGARLSGRDAVRLGLADHLADTDDEIRDRALGLGAEIARSAPLAIRSIRRTLRGGLAEQIRIATEHELSEQLRLFETEDFTEGVSAAAARREPVFKGR